MGGAGRAGGAARGRAAMGAVRSDEALHSTATGIFCVPALFENFNNVWCPLEARLVLITRSALSSLSRLCAAILRPRLLEIAFDSVHSFRCRPV